MIRTSDAELREQLSHYKFYRTIKLTETISTPGNDRYEAIHKTIKRAIDALDLKGRRVLDVGCRDGLFSFEAERLGAAEVVGIDNDLSRGAVEVVIPFLDSKVRMQRMNVYDLRPEHFGTFDVVFFFGVLYHLRYPFWGLRALRDVMKPGGHLLIDTAVYEGVQDSPLLYCPVGPESPYAVFGDSTSSTFFNEKGLVDTMESMGFRHVSTGLVMPRWVGPFASRKHALKVAVKELFTGRQKREEPPVNRGVFHFRYEGMDRDSDLWRYWEGTHDEHARYGG
jgi:SAM-dependent methyltransferase